MLEKYGLDPDPNPKLDPELEKFKAGSGSEINHSRSATMIVTSLQRCGAELSCEVNDEKC